MKRLLCLFLCFLCFCGCAAEEVKSAALKPYQIHYEKPEEPVLLETVSYPAKRTDFISAFHYASDSIGTSVSAEEKLTTIDVWDWLDSSKQVVSTTYGVPFYNDQTYELSMTVSSSIADTLTIVFDDYTNVLYQKSFDISEESRIIAVEYTHKGGNVDDGVVKLVYTKKNESVSGSINIENMSIQRISGIDYNVKINQLGYLPESQKTAIFKFNAGDWFDVVNTETNQIVYTGQIVGRVENSDTGEVNYYGDFSCVSEPGKYRIVSQLNGRSYEFSIDHQIYQPLLSDALKMITLQRCGFALSEETAGAFSHDVCHNSLTRSYTSWEEMDVTGGWHDAGDYGRYTLTAVKTINDLLLSYYVYPESFSDEMGLPESGNGIPDILDEARIGLDWLMKMQLDWGPVHAASVTTQFADFVLPEQDQQEIWVLAEENTSTASAAGAFAMASIIYEKFDDQISKEYLRRAQLAYDYCLQVRGEADKNNPSDISAGDYRNTSDEDEIYFAAAMLYTATHEERYLDEIDKTIESSMNLFGLSYEDFSGYGSYCLLQDEEFKNKKEYALLYNSLMEHTQNLVWDNVNDGYHLTIESYHWGANMDVANNAMMLLLAYDINPAVELLDCAFEQLSYLLGKNSVNTSFISGYGTNFPVNIHHRIAEVNHAILYGALVGGPDGSFDSSLPPAKKYIDSTDSYTMNEVAIYYNSPLVFVLSAFQQ